jgi:hypothetical protein
MAKAIGCTNAHRIPADRPGFAIEGAMFTTKDAPIIIDDFTP